MKELKFLRCHPSNTLECLATLTNSVKEDGWIQLLNFEGNNINIPTHLLPNGSGIILSSGGSSGKGYQCLHQYSHLNQSAIATSTWLKNRNIVAQFRLMNTSQLPISA